MKILDPQDLIVGCAVTLCCHLDLYTIETEEQLREVQAEWDDEIGYEAWSSAKEAYLDIAKRWPNGSDERKECLRLASETPNVELTGKGKGRIYVTGIAVRMLWKCDRTRAQIRMREAGQTANLAWSG